MNYERLQELYKLDQNYADYEKTAAHVIGSDSNNWFSTFTIDKGSNDGIEVDMNVMAGSGLVGIVVDVGPTWANSPLHHRRFQQCQRYGSVHIGPAVSFSGDLSLIERGADHALSRLENNDNDGCR